ncbi:MFS transporter [Microbacterium schleiferi]|uniref:MFS transporter n=1 Tax=Microbacterium schleiferi TaxID=69362 RepID=A0A7S8N016_9MICO|nr:MFS transporter [Microbacterium schleiferi]QPE05460.1 MFS transporter [Microbacterium schleiferi]
MTEAQPARVRMSRRSVIALVTLVIATLGAALPLSMVAPTLAITADQFGTTAAESSWTLTIVLVVAATTTPVIGRLGDAFGPGRVLLILIPIVMVGLAIAGLASSMGELIAGRALQGLGGGVFPLAVALARHAVPEARRAMAVGLLTATFATGTGLGVVIAGVLVDRIGTQALAWVPFALLAVAEVMALGLISAPRTQREPLHLAPSLLLAAGIAVLLFAVTEAPRSDAEVVLTAASLGVGAAIIAVWAWLVMTRSASAGMSHLRIRALWSSHLTSAFFGAALFATFVALPVYVEVQGTTPGPLTPATLAGLLLLPATAAMAAVAPLTGILRRRLGRRGPAVLGAAATVIGGIILAAGAHTLASLLAGSILLGAGVAAGSAAIINVLVDVTDDDTLASVSGVNIAARQIGGAFGAAGCASLLATSGERPDLDAYTLAFGLIAVLAVAALLASLLIPARQVPAFVKPEGR